MFFKSAVAASLIAVVSAHQNWHQFWVNDVTPGYQVGIRMPPSNSPVTDVKSNDISCNVNGNKIPSGVETVPAKEGDTIKVQWDSSSHPGPITHFLYGPVDDAANTAGFGAGWFKINEFDREGDKWANEIMESQNMTYEFKLPTGLQSGEYLLRSEMLALHGSQTVGGAQFYIGCAQLKITGTGGGCNPRISLPGAYNAEDDDIYIPNIYYGFNISTYSAPGGAVATCRGSGATPATLANTIATTTAAATPTSAAFTATSVSASGPAVTAPSVSIPYATGNATVIPSLTTGPAPTTTGVVPSSVISAISSLTAALPSSVLTSTIPAPTGSQSGSSSPISGLTVAELLDLLKQVLTQLFSSSGSNKARRHARDVSA